MSEMVNLLPNDTLIVMTNKANSEEVLGYAFCTEPAADEPEGRDQVQRWLLLSRRPEDRPPMRTVIFTTVDYLAKNLDQETLAKILGDWSEVTTLEGFIENAKKTFNLALGKCYYVKVNCMGSNPVKSGATGHYKIARPIADRVPPALQPAPVPGQQTDTGTRWVRIAERVVGVEFTAHIEENNTIECWLLYGGYSPEPADGFEIIIGDIDDQGPGDGEAHAHNSIERFFEQTERLLGASDVCIFAHCMYHTEFPGTP